MFKLQIASAFISLICGAKCLLTPVVCRCCLNSSMVVLEMLISRNMPSSLEVNWQPHSVWAIRRSIFSKTNYCLWSTHSSHPAYCMCPGVYLTYTLDKTLPWDTLMIRSPRYSYNTTENVNSIFQMGGKQYTAWNHLCLITSSHLWLQQNPGITVHHGIKIDNLYNVVHSIFLVYYYNKNTTSTSKT